MMTVLAIAFILLAFVGARLPDAAEPFHPDYMARNRTRAINGIFVAFILASHCYTNDFFRTLLTHADTGFVLLRDAIGQLCVVSFLFYSGYGIFLSIRAKGRPYLRALVTRRFPMLLLHFDSAVLLFILLRLALGKTYSGSHLLLTLFAWESVGNSCWFIFVTLAFYLFTALAFRLFPRRPLAAILLLSALAAVLGCLFAAADKTVAWYYTLTAFPVGMLYALVQPRFERLCLSSTRRWLLTLLSLLALLLVFHAFRKHALAYNAMAVAFAILLPVVTSRLRLDNPILQFLGRHIFSIYILQRIFMILLNRFGPGILNRYIPPSFSAATYFALAASATCFLAILFDVLWSRLDAKLFPPINAPTSPRIS